MSQGTLLLLFLPRSTLVLLFLYFLGQGLGIDPMKIWTMKRETKEYSA